MKPKFIYNRGNSVVEPLIASDRKVQLIYRDGTLEDEPDWSWTYYWKHDLDSCDIMAYRIIGDEK